VNWLKAVRSFPALRREYLMLGEKLLSEHPRRLTRKELHSYFWPWFASLFWEREPFGGFRACMTFPAARFLEKQLTSASRVFEYGTSGSTLYFSKRVAELVTVEHDRVQLDRTWAHMRWRGKTRWRSHLAEPVESQEPGRYPPTDPQAYASTESRFAGQSFRAYATAIDRYDDNYFDVVLIDGRARPSCFKHAVAKVKFGGYVVLDDAEREEYRWVEEAARKLGFELREFWGPGPYHRHFWRTIFLRKVGERFALNELDAKLERHLHFDGGTFVEAGANDGVAQSNTLYFEARRGWRGLLVEPVPHLAEECRRFRPHALVEQVALVPPEREGASVALRYANLMSVVKGGMKTSDEEEAHIAAGCDVQKIQTYDLSARGATLSSLLDKHGLQHVDLLSLDIEGYELAALQGLDFQRHRPRYILVEARYRDEVHAYLASRYDLVEELSFHDLLYRIKGDEGPSPLRLSR
jgi:FkbM family methyltransferase